MTLTEWLRRQKVRRRRNDRASSVGRARGPAGLSTTPMHNAGLAIDLGKQ